MKLLFWMGILMSVSFFANAAEPSGEAVLDSGAKMSVISVMDQPAQTLWDYLKIAPQKSRMFPGAFEKSSSRMHCTKFPAKTTMNPTTTDSYICKFGVAPSGNVKNAYFSTK